MRPDERMRIDHKVVSRAHRMAGGELETVAALANSGEVLEVIRGERCNDPQIEPMQF